MFNYTEMTEEQLRELRRMARKAEAYCDDRIAEDKSPEDVRLWKRGAVKYYQLWSDVCNEMDKRG